MSACTLLNGTRRWRWKKLRASENTISEEPQERNDNKNEETEIENMKFIKNEQDLINGNLIKYDQSSSSRLFNVVAVADIKEHSSSSSSSTIRVPNDNSDGRPLRGLNHGEYHDESAYIIHQTPSRMQSRSHNEQLDHLDGDGISSSKQKARAAFVKRRYKRVLLKPEHTNNNNNNNRLIKSKKSLRSFLHLLALLLVVIIHPMSSSCSSSAVSSASENLASRAHLEPNLAHDISTEILDSFKEQRSPRVDQTGDSNSNSNNNNINNNNIHGNIRAARQATQLFAPANLAAFVRHQQNMHQTNAGDSFGSRLAAPSPSLPITGDLQTFGSQAQQTNAPSNQLLNTNTNGNDNGNNLISSFSNRQGQLDEANQLQPQLLRQRQLPAMNRAATASNIMQSSQRSQLQPTLAASNQANQLNHGNQSPFRPASRPQSPQLQSQSQSQPQSGLLPMPPLPPPPFQPSRAGSNSQLPTLSAFDLSSLANLANQAGTGNSLQQQNQQSQATFTRRLPLSTQQQQPSRVVASSQSLSNPTELPFIRQVFRPSSDQSGQPVDQASQLIGGDHSSASTSGRPTPPPLFVPHSQSGRRFSSSNGAQQAGSRPRSSPLLDPSSNGGFSPMRPAAQEQPSSQQSAQSNAQPTREQVFFEPTNLNRLQSTPTASVQQQQPGSSNRIVAPSNGSNTRTNVSNGLSIMDQTANSGNRRRAPARRPSQRPSLPIINSQQQQQQTNDVIRLASSAIQAANEGLALVGSPSTQASSASTASSEPTISSGTSSSSPATTAATSGSTVSTSPLVTTTLTEQPVTISGRRNAAPLRSSANIFALTSLATSAPSSFSPALPINAAMAAVGGRRRIPVRPQNSNSQSRSTAIASLAATQATTLPTTLTTAPITTSTQQPPFSSSHSPIRSSTRGSTSVRRPELEEFYETISSAGNPSSMTTQIDAFGSSSASSGQTASLVPRIAGSTSTTSATTLAATNSDNDSFGSRLSGSIGSSGLDQSNPGSLNEHQLRPTINEQLSSEAEHHSSNTHTNQNSNEHQSQHNVQSNQNQNQGPNQQQAGPVLVPVTYMTTLTYLTTVLHGTHTLQTSHESTVRSTELATLNAQLMDQIEHRRPLIEPTATMSVSSKTKGKGTTIVNLKSAVSAYNQELVEALGVQATSAPTIIPPMDLQPVAVGTTTTTTSNSVGFSDNELQANNNNNKIRVSRTVDLNDLEGAQGKSLMTELHYYYTMRPASGIGSQISGQTIDVTSVRSELIGAKSLDSNELLGVLVADQTDGNQIIDSNGMLRLHERPAIILGSTMDKDGATMTEINMNLASYIKFDDISNTLVDVKPSKLASMMDQPMGRGGQRRKHQPQLETSFDLQLQFSRALDRLNGSPTTTTTTTTDQAQSSVSPSSGQPTPSLETISIPSMAKPGADLLRSTSAPSPTDQTRSSESLSRSSLRSRVTSSRIRNGAQQQLTRQPSIVTSSVVIPASEMSTASNLTANRGQQRPFRSRIVRPSTKLIDGNTAIQASASLSGDSQSSAGSQSIEPSRLTKPRLVVVTRTGQFGVRASAIGSNQQTQEAPGSIIQPSETPGTPNVVVSSRFLRPNRFRSSTTRAPQQPVNSPVEPSSSSPIQTSTSDKPTREEPAIESSSTQNDSQTTQASSKAPSTSSKESQNEPAVESTTQRITTSPAVPTISDEKKPTSEGSELGASANGLIDGPTSVIVTYFTTTTHTIPFTINSETIFTTIEETNSRVATEMMRDLAATPFIQSPQNYVQPTQVYSNIQPTLAPSFQPSTDFTGSQGSTSGSPAPSEDSGSKVEPSFVVALNTRTYFTTFTYFTTYSAGTATPTIKSSESTTSNIVTETVTSMSPIEPSTRMPQPTIMMSEAPTLPITTNSLPTSSRDTLTTNSEPGSSSVNSITSEQSTTVAIPQSESTTTTPAPTSLVSSTTESSSTSPMDSSPTLTSIDLTQPNLKHSPLNQQPSDSSPSLITLVPNIQTTPTSGSSVEDSYSNNGDKITRTKSIYTTLTHFITFFSGTKTQLSTIQEISPTVLTEYIDRTDYERQLQLESAKMKDAGVVIVPTRSMDQAFQIQMTSSPLPPTTTIAHSSSTSEETSSTSSSDINQTSGESNQPSSGSATQNDFWTTTTETSSQAPEVKVLASQHEQAESKQVNGANSIIELSDLMASNSSQTGRVALSENLGAAIKDIVQLLAGNRTTNPMVPISGVPIPTTPIGSDQSSSESGETSQTTATMSSTTTTTASPTSLNIESAPQTTPKRPNGPKWYGRSKEQQLQQLQGSISSPTMSPSTQSSTQSGDQSTMSKPTPELDSSTIRPVTGEDQNTGPTIFFGDDNGEDRKKQVKTVWPGSQSSVLVTNIEPSTRLLTLTTTRVYYTKDSPFTVTSSFTTAIPPRTFVSTIVGTRTQVNQLPAQTPTFMNPQQSSAISSDLIGRSNSNNPKSVGNRQETLAENSRLAVQEKQRKQQQQIENQRKKQQPQQTQAQPKSTKPKLDMKIDQSQNVNASANINQCQPACKEKNKEVCKFTPASENNGSSGTFACACRPGYHMMVNPNTGKRQCQEIQSYVILLRLMQIGDQQVAYKRELQDRASSDYKQMSRVIKDHVKRAYMTSDLTRDRFVSVDVINYARGKQHTSIGNISQQDSISNGVFVNMTVQLQPLVGNQNEPINEATLKEELIKKLNMRQAAALAAASSPGSNSASSTTTTNDPSMPADQTSSNETISSSSEDSVLPNPNALFLADVEQVMDLDECANPNLNDCSDGATCINEIGSYKCDCGEYPDLNPLHPGRSCAMELKACDYCNNRGDCIRVPSLLTSTAFNSSSINLQQRFSTVCQCNPFYLGRRCDINGWVLATVVPTTSIFLIVSICLVICLCRRWRKRNALSKGFRNIGSFGPNLLSGTLDRKAMLESSSESSDTHQRSHHAHHHGHLRGATNAIYDVNGTIPSDPPSSSNESSPRQMVRNQAIDSANQQQSMGNYCNSIPPQIVIPRARHNQVNYAVHRGQVYMW